jgi:hypothetical protein
MDSDVRAAMTAFTNHGWSVSGTGAVSNQADIRTISIPTSGKRAIAASQPLRGDANPSGTRLAPIPIRISVDGRFSEDDMRNLRLEVLKPRLQIANSELRFVQIGRYSLHFAASWVTLIL